MMKKKVMIIVCYCGKLPEWFPLWLLSCKYNPEFHFMLVTDQKVTELFPPNVFLLNLSLKELRQRFSNVLGFPAKLSDGYKLCDYKPLYGLAFQEELSGYDFWGHCDIDLIWGNLRKFIDEELLDRYVRIGAYGHLVLYQNTDEVNYFFKEPGSIFPFETVFRDEDHYGFDEITGMNRIFKKKGIDFYNLSIADANWLLSRISVQALKSGEEVYYWYEGGVYRAYRDREGCFKTYEYAYLHFQKKRPVCHLEENYENGFFITAREFKPLYDYPLSLKDIERESEFKGGVWEGMDLFSGYARRVNDFLFQKNMHQKKILLKKALYNETDKFMEKLRIYLVKVKVF